VDLYLLRHAEDRAAAEGRFGDEGLTRHGEAQARQVSSALASIPFTRAECSPLRRARETAELVLKGRSVALQIEQDLAEGSAGALLGIGVDEAGALYPQDFRVGRTVVARIRAAARTAPDGESRAAFLERARRVAAHWRRTLAKPGDPVLVVSHGGILNFALQDLLGLALRDEVPFGFDHGGLARLVSYTETPAFGPFVMVRFGIPQE
jgi:probable phosphoglycerate mutase